VLEQQTLPVAASLLHKRRLHAAQRVEHGGTCGLSCPPLAKGCLAELMVFVSGRHLWLLCTVVRGQPLLAQGFLLVEKAEAVLLGFCSGWRCWLCAR
jgi:hypothetical protein